ncbi:MAG TPA: TlpA disulfide reductase family protein [Burkholderiales bacterium]|nr:TlpA disulfide reductase family protein [Burkholderiales bacterium]
MIRLFFVLLFLSLPAHADEFEFKDMKGEVLKLSSYSGKWVLVNFWSPTDPASRSEIPELVKLYDAHGKKNLVVIGIAMNYRNAKAVSDFAAANRIPYPVVLGTDDIAEEIGEFPRLPANFLYNPSGELTAAKTGTITSEDVERMIR